MAPRKTERLVNLTICLLATRRYLTREQIRDSVEGYRDLSDAAFQRTFERDKDELRALGVPIEVGSFDAFFEDEQGYRISRTDFEAPAISFDPAEVSVLGAAMRVWQQESTADRTAMALAKLRAAGVEPDASRLAALAPAVGAVEPAFDEVWSATVSRTPIAFRYRDGAEDRVVEPWRLTWRKGRWYLVGFDQGRRAPRLFKMARITTLPTPAGRPGSFETPDVDLAELTRNLLPARPDRTAVLLIRDGRAPGLRRSGEQVDGAAPEGFSRWEVPYATRGDFVPSLAALGADAVVLAPPELRAAVRAHLAEVVAAQAVAP